MHHRTVVTRRLTAIISAPLLLLALAACGGADEPAATSGESASSSASSAPAEATPDDPQAADDGADDGAGKLTTKTFLPALKKAVLDAGTVHMSMTLGGQGGGQGGGQAQSFAAEGDARLDEKNPAMELKLTGPSFQGGGAQMIIVDEVVYLSAPPDIPRGKYLKIDPEDPNDPFARGFGGLREQLDPLGTFGAFDAGLRRVEFVTTEEVDGEQLDKYRVTVDAAKAMKAQGQKPVPGMPKTFGYFIWLDDADLMRKVTFELGPVSLDTTLSDWGEPVDITAPGPADLVEQPSRPS